MKNLFLSMVCAIITISASAQMPIITAENSKTVFVDKPGKWLIYQTGEIVELSDSADPRKTLIECADQGCFGWVVENVGDQQCYVTITDKGVIFRHNRKSLIAKKPEGLTTSAN
jgi:hypothetical protein